MSQVSLEGAGAGRTGEPIIRVENLTVFFKKESGITRKRTAYIKAVDHISFDVFESEFVSIVGETGSGKTTLGKCLVGLEKPTSGKIILDGEEISGLRGRRFRDHARKVQMVFQDPFESLVPRQDVFTTIATPIRRLLGEKNGETLRQTVIQLLEEVGLQPNEIMRRLPHQLSGGQRQRVSIARALASNPRVLVADEPITMLDAAQRLNFLSLLSKLRQKRNLTVLMITHDLASAKITSDKIVVMYLGKVVEMAPASMIISKPHHPYVELILASHRSLTEAVAEKVADKGEFGAQRPSTGCVFEPRCKYAISVCKSTEPVLSQLSPKHYAACHNPLNTAG